MDSLVALKRSLEHDVRHNKKPVPSSPRQINKGGLDSHVDVGFERVTYQLQCSMMACVQMKFR